jgi:hypothetical protein
MNMQDGQISGIVIAAGHEARVQAALEFEAIAPVPALHEAEREQVPAVLTTARTIPEPSAVFASTKISAERLQTLPLLALPGREAAYPMARPTSATAHQDQARMVAPVTAPATEVSVLVPPSHVAIAANVAIIGAPMLRRFGNEGTAVATTAVIRARAAVRSAAIEALAGAAENRDAVGTAATIDAAELQGLPLAERDWRDINSGPPLASDKADSPSRRQSQLSTILVDGVSTRLAFGGTGTGRTRERDGSLIGPGSSEATLRLVQNGTGDADAVAGRGFRGRTEIQTMRGSNNLRGQLSLFTRQNILGAQNPFAQWVQQTGPPATAEVPTFAGQPFTPGDRNLQWALSLGGRAPRSHVFWFAALDNSERNDPAVSTVKHADNFFAQSSNDEMQVLSARLRLSAADPVTEAVAAYTTVLQSLDGLLGPAPRTSSRWTGFGRVDWSLGAHHRFAIEGTDTQWDAPGGGFERSAANLGNHSYGSSDTSEQSMQGRWEVAVRPNLVAVTQGLIGRHNRTMPPETPSPYEQSFDVNAWGRLPQMVVDSRYGFTIGTPARFGPGSYPDEHLYKAQEQVAWVHGRLLVKAGLDLSHNTDTTSFLRNQTGTYNYASVENFASDALSFAAFGLNGQLNPMEQHNCDQTGKVWVDTAGTVHGVGDLPCYSSYSQTLGPADWWLRTNDWAAYTTAQWQLKKQVLFSLGMRWEREQAPPSLAKLDNPDLPLTRKLPSFGNEWGPRASLAIGTGERHGPVIRLGYGMFFGRTPNATLETELTQTGSLHGDLRFFMRPTDNLNAGGAPPFPYVLAGEPASVVKPAAVEFAPAFHNGEMHEAVASIEEALPGHLHLDASAAASLGRRLPMTLDANIDPAVNPKTITYAVEDGNQTGPIKLPRITVPFYASWPSSDTSIGFAGRLNPNYQQVMEIFSRANSIYEAAIVRLTRTSRSGLTLHARYTYAHAMDWNPDDSTSVTGPSVLDPANLRAEYGTSDLDVRHSLSTDVLWAPRWKLHNLAGHIVNGWMLSGIGAFHSGTPYSMRTAGSLAKEFDSKGTAIVALSTGMNGYGGENRVYGVGRNTFRYPATWKADLRIAKRFNLGEMRQLELLAESFNLFNHQNVTELEAVGYSIESGTVEGGMPRLNFLTGIKTGQTEFGHPLNVNATDFYRPRQIQFGVRLKF